MTRRDEPGPSLAEQLLLDFIDRLEDGEPVDFERLCAEHPEEAERLRELRPTFDAIERMLDSVVRRDGPEARGGFASDAQPSFPPSTTGASRYRVGHSIGRGGMGEVFTAWDGALDRRLALKVARTDRPASAARFLAEARIMARLTHPGVVPVHDLGRDDQDRLYFTMLEVDGRTFAEVITEMHRGDSAERSLRLSRAVDALARVCETVAYAHARQVVHRDLKPSNVMLGSFGEVFVMDWGLARDLAADEADETIGGDDGAQAGTPPDETGTGEVLGTAGYMAPEQAEGGARVADERSDVYSLGAMLYHVLAGRMPYQQPGESSTPAELLDRVRSGPPTRIDEVGARWAPDELISVCTRAMERDRTARYPSAAALAGDLRAWLAGRVVAAHGTGLAVSVTKWIRRNQLAAAALAVALLAALASISGIAWTQREALGRVRAEREGAERVASFLESVFAAESPFHETRGLSLDDLLATGREMLADDPDLDPTVRARLADVVGKVHRQTGRRGPSLELARLAVALAEEHLGPDDLETWRYRSNLAVALEHTAAPEKIVLQRRILDACERLLGPSHVEADRARFALAQTLGKAGEREESSELLRFLWRSRSATYGNEARETAIAASEVGESYYHSQRYSEAAEILGAATATLTATAGRDHPATIAAESGLLLARMRVVAKAQKDDLVPGFEDLLVRARGRLGPEHPMTLAIRTNLGYLLDEVGRRGEAERELRDAVAGLERVNGPLDPTLLAAEARLAGIFLARGAYEDAVAAYESVLGRMGSLPGMPDRRMTIYRRRLGVALGSAGDRARAIEVLRAAFADAERGLGADDKETLETAVQLGAVLVLDGQASEAARQLVPAATAARRLFGPLHGLSVKALEWSYLALVTNGRSDAGEAIIEEWSDESLSSPDPEPRRLANLARALVRAGHSLHSKGDYVGAVPAYRQSLRLSRAAEGWTIDSLRVGNLLALDQLRTGEQGLARALWSEMLPVAEETLGAHDLSVNIAVNLGALELEHGDLGTADEILARALDASRRALGEDHVRTLDAAHWLGSVRRRQGRLDDARELMEFCLEARERTLGPAHRTTLGTLENLVELHIEQADLATAHALAERLVKRTPPDDPEATARETSLRSIAERLVRER